MLFREQKIQKPKTRPLNGSSLAMLKAPNGI